MKRILCGYIFSLIVTVCVIGLLSDAWQRAPNAPINDQHAQHDGHQHRDAAYLRNGSDDKRQNSRARHTERGRKADAAHVQMRGEDLGGSDDGGGKERAEEEANECDGNSRGEEVGYEPEDEVRSGR